ncbi:MAG: hypothetical protein IKU28_00715 [Erysipelotrichaceae bacterium]|nr:hypothetical protein [Erysipelotrichaceae bacterium]
MGDGKVVDLSSLSAFEHGKRNLNEEQLIWLFETIGYDYDEVVKSYDFEKEYLNIVDAICLGETQNAESLFFSCVENGAFNTLGCINFSLLKYVLSTMNSKRILVDSTCIMFEEMYSPIQKAILQVAKACELKILGDFDSAIRLLKEAERMIYDLKIQAWITHLYGVIYGLVGNYVEAAVALLKAKQNYGDFLSVIRMIQTELNLGNIYLSTLSYKKAEESYLIAYQQSMNLKDSSYLLTKCFNSLCWLYFETNQYDKVKNLLLNKPLELVESRNTYFVLAWSYYKIGNYEESIRYCKEGLEKFTDYSYVCMIYEYIMKACKGIKTGQDALLRKIIETEDYDHDALTEKLFTYEIIDIYERRKNYEKAFKYAKKLLNR